MNNLIRQATREDLPALQQLAKESFEVTYRETIAPHLLVPYIEKHFSTGQLENELADDNNTFLVSCDDDQITGYLKLRESKTPDCVKSDTSLEIERIYADPAFKRRGIGSALIKAAVDEAALRDRTSVWLGVFQKNISAVAFYQAKDFEIAGTTIFVMDGEEQDDYIMVKRIYKLQLGLI